MSRRIAALTDRFTHPPPPIQLYATGSRVLGLSPEGESREASFTGLDQNEEPFALDIIHVKTNTHSSISVYSSNHSSTIYYCMQITLNIIHLLEYSDPISVGNASQQPHPRLSTWTPAGYRTSSAQPRQIMHAFILSCTTLVLPSFKGGTLPLGRVECTQTEITSSSSSFSTSPTLHIIAHQDFQADYAWMIVWMFDSEIRFTPERTTDSSS